MYQFKNGILTVAATLLAACAMPAAAQDDSQGGVSTDGLTLVEQNRNGWSLMGCSQVGGDSTDGDLRTLTDDNFTSYWHSYYDAANNEEKGEGSHHFFIIDRGEHYAEHAIAGFGYLPRQNNQGNGFIQKFRIYVLGAEEAENIAAIPHVSEGTTKDNAQGAHSAIDTYLADKTAVATDHNVDGTTVNQGKFEYDYTSYDSSRPNPQNLQQVRFNETQTGRYVIFVSDETAGSQGNKHANCAEFYLYSGIAEENMVDVKVTLLRHREDLADRVLYEGTRQLYVGQTVPAYGFATCTTQGTITADTKELTYVINPTEEVYIYNAQGSSATFGADASHRRIIGTKSYNGAPVLTVSSTPKALLLIKSNISDDNDVFYLCDPEGEFKGKFGGNIKNNQNIVPLTDAPRDAQRYCVIRNSNGTVAIRNENRRNGTSDYMNHYGNSDPYLGGWQQAEATAQMGSHWFIVPTSNVATFEANLEYYSSTEYGAGRLSSLLSQARAQLGEMSHDSQEYTNLNAAIERAAKADFGRDNIAEIYTNLEDNMDADERARTAFLTYTGIRYTEYNAAYKALGNTHISIPGWAAATDEKLIALFDAITSGDNTAKGNAARSVSGACTANANDGAAFTEGIWYRIQNTDEARGYLCVTDDGVLTTSINDNAPSINDAANADNYRFGFVTVDGRGYLYSAKTRTPLYAFGEQGTAFTERHDYTWTLAADNVATPVVINRYKGGIAHSVIVEGGKNSTSDRCAITMVTDRGERPVLTAWGINSDLVGMGLLITYNGHDTTGSADAVRNAITAANTAVAAEVEKQLADIDENSAPIVNTLTTDAIAAISAAATADHKNHLLKTGTRVALTSGGVYQIMNAATGKYIGIVNDAQGELDAITGTACNWLATAVEGEDNTYTLTHTLTEAAAATPAAMMRAAGDRTTIHLTIGDKTSHSIVPGEYGKVNIGDTAYVMTATDGEAESTTTGICEIEASQAAGPTAVYDLQGRRLSAPAKGINIINGRKVMIK